MQEYAVHGVIYVVDASDLSRIEESKNILENLLFNEKLAGKPVLVLANKQDKQNALDEIDIVEVLQLEPLVNQQKCHTLVKVCSAVNDSPSKKKKIDKRLLSGYRWLLHQIQREYDILNGRVETDSREELTRFEAQRALQRKRMEESEEKVEVQNGTDAVNHVGINGIASESDSTQYSGVPKNITSKIRDQLEKKNERQKFTLPKGFRSNKIYPGNGETIEQLQGPSVKSDFSRPHSSTETSMTLRALTSPLHIHNVNFPRQRLTASRYSTNDRPYTSRSLGTEVGVWGLDRELDVIYPAQITRHVITEEGIKDEVVIEYLKKD